MILFVDTETTGRPRDYSLPASDTNNWPRIVQLAWILSDYSGNQISEGNYIIKPDGYEIESTAANVHGITTEYATQNGSDALEVLDVFFNVCSDARMIVAHNLNFDRKVISSQFIRCFYGDILESMPGICTMKSSTQYCALPNMKWPSLKELHFTLFGEDFLGAHDAMNDIRATFKCFWELERLGVVSVLDANVSVMNTIKIGPISLHDESGNVVADRNNDEILMQQILDEWESIMPNNNSIPIKELPNNTIEIDRPSILPYENINWQELDEIIAKKNNTQQEEPKKILNYLEKFFAFFFIALGVLYIIYHIIDAFI